MTLDEKIVILLTPGVGKKMAELTVKKECAFLGISPDSITPQHLPTIAKDIAETVSIFIGCSKADDLETMIKELK